MVVCLDFHEIRKTRCVAIPDGGAAVRTYVPRIGFILSLKVNIEQCMVP